VSIIKLVLLVTIGLWASGNDCMEAIVRVRQETNQKTLSDFFNTIYNSNLLCPENVEFKAVGNETMFDIIISEPGIFFTFIFTEGSKYENLAFSYLSNPIGDTEKFDVSKHKEGVLQGLENDSLKTKANSFIDRLIDAQKKLGIF